MVKWMVRVDSGHPIGLTTPWKEPQMAEEGVHRWRDFEIDLFDTFLIIEEEPG
jgi:hypothetical protein